MLLASSSENAKTLGKSGGFKQFLSRAVYKKVYEGDGHGSLYFDTRFTYYILSSIYANCSGIRVYPTILLGMVALSSWF